MLLYKSSKFLITIIILLSLFLFYRGSFILHAAETVSSDNIEEKQDKLEDQIEAIEKKKAKTQKQLEQSRNLLSKTQVQVNQTRGLLKETEADIKRKEMELQSSLKKIEFTKKMLSEYIREIYYSDHEDPLIKLVAAPDDLSRLYDNFNRTLSAEEKVLEALYTLHGSKTEMEEVKEDLAGKKSDHEKLLTIQKGEQYEIKTDIYEAQSTLEELNAKIDKLKKELTSLLGSAVSYKNIVDAAEFASRVTGIRKDYLLGVLVVESNLGRYTGGCNYKQSRMSGARLADFKEIAKSLKYDFTKLKVSCPPSGYKGTGGAMGVGQFMPDTWLGYRNSIASVTGHNPPDPWSLTDGVVAMALKLSKVSGVTDHKRNAEAKAYCIYLAGGNWANYCDGKGVNYGGKVLYWADNYERLLK